MRPNLRKADNSEMVPMFNEILNYLFWGEGLYFYMAC